MNAVPIASLPVQVRADIVTAGIRNGTSEDGMRKSLAIPAIATLALAGPVMAGDFSYNTLELGLYRRVDR